jgi:hypothetical protein
MKNAKAKARGHPALSAAFRNKIVSTRNRELYGNKVMGSGVICSRDKNFGLKKGFKFGLLFSPYFSLVPLRCKFGNGN